MDTDNDNIQDNRVRRVNSGANLQRVKSGNLRLISGILLGFIALLVILVFLFFKLSESLGIGNVFVLGYDFLVGSTGSLPQVNGRTNILLMGKSGGSHEGPDLTDTMLVVSVGLVKKDIVIVSIPRDLWMPDMRAKINSAYYWGKQKRNSGISFAKAETEKVVGLPIHYGVVFDFSSFKDVIDALGGIQINVENSFTDKFYPIAGRESDLCGGDPKLACRYETIVFDSGLQTMNGERALKYVRSRHAEGPEGTDIAREARQQKIIDAIKLKATDPKVFLSPKVVSTLVKIIKKYVETDLDGPASAVIARKILQGEKNTRQYLIPEDLLVVPKPSKVYDNLYVFIPKAGNGNWKDINDWVLNITDGG